MYLTLNSLLINQYITMYIYHIRIYYITNYLSLFIEFCYIIIKLFSLFLYLNLYLQLIFILIALYNYILYTPPGLMYLTLSNNLYTYLIFLINCRANIKKKYLFMFFSSIKIVFYIIKPYIPNIYL